MFAFLTRLVSCTSESSLPKDDISVPPKKEELAAGDLASPPAVAAQATLVPPTPTASVAAPDTKGLFVTHADASPAKEPFVSYGNYSESGTVADALAARSPSVSEGAAAETPATLSEAIQVGEAVAAAVVAAAVDGPRKSEYLAYWAPDSFCDSALATKKAFEESLKLPIGARCMLERSARGIADPSAAAPPAAAKKSLPSERVYLD